MSLWLTADTHLGHGKVLEMKWRPDDYEKRIHDAIMKDVKPADVLVHLGDVSLGDDERLHNIYIQQWPGKKILVRGNHDSRSDSWYYDHGWGAVCRLMMIDRFGKRIVLSHIPLEDKGWFDCNIHGHFHDNKHATVRAKEPEIAAILCPKHLLLAIEDTAYRPIMLDTFYKKHEQELKGPRNAFLLAAEKRGEA